MNQMVAPWIFVLIALVFFAGPFRRRAWRRARWDYQRGDEPWNRDPPRRTPDQEKREREKEEQLEALETRVNELESRLDYAERLMLQRRESQPGGIIEAGK